MTGENVLIFNESQMKRAVQYWLNEAFLQNAHKVRVESMRPRKKGNGQWVYEVVIVPPDHVKQAQVNGINTSHKEVPHAH